MIALSEKRFNELLNAFHRKTIAVVGDVMLDRYIWGNVSRISPEAPVPVIDVLDESARLGGAANVAHNIHSLGGKAVLIGVVGNDASGDMLTQLVRTEGFTTEGIMRDSSRPTTVKTRIIAHSQHVARVDRESRTEIDETTRTRVINFIRENISNFEAIVLEDYNKGLMGKEFIREAIEIAAKAGTMITVDPKLRNFFEYKRVTLFKPNLKEAEEALGMRVQNLEEARSAGNEILRRLDAEYVLMTRGEKGMSLFSRSGSEYHATAKARHVADVSGAGDTVIATTTLSLAAGASAQEAATLANLAAGVVCGEVGVVPISIEGLRAAIVRDNHQSHAEEDRS